jgi:hypothetical protein
MDSNRPQLLGSWTYVALVVGNSIGSGVVPLPSSLAPYGLNRMIAWRLTACGAGYLTSLMPMGMMRDRPPVTV